MVSSLLYNCQYEQWLQQFMNARCAGPAPLEAIAQQISSATGPSGPNDEYLYGLARALKQVLTQALTRYAAGSYLYELPC